MQTLSVTIKNREKILLQTTAKAVSSWNEKGVFDILPEHAHFISIIKQHITIHPVDAEKHHMPIDTGLLCVWDNTVSVYLDITSPLTKE